MPIYEYRCEQCTHEFEILVVRHDETVQCPQCHAPAKTDFHPCRGRRRTGHRLRRGSLLTGTGLRCGNMPSLPVREALNMKYRNNRSRGTVYLFIDVCH